MTFGKSTRAFLQEEESVYYTHHQTICGSCVDHQTFNYLDLPSTRVYSRASCAGKPEQIPQPAVQIPDSPIPDPPVQIQVTPEPTTPQPPVQLFLPDPPQPSVQIILSGPPVVETLEPSLTGDSYIDQIMSSVFGDCSQQGLPPAYTQEPQLLDTVPSLFDESNNLISFLDHFETGLAIEQQETPMDLTMLRLKKKVRKPTGFKPTFGVHILRSFGKTVIVFTSHLDLTRDKGVDLRFFQVGRPPSHRVWDAHQPQTTDAYILDIADCTLVADVYVKWFTWLNDYEMHRDDNVPWRMVGLQHWKRALEKHVQCSHEKA
ncbi:hypothetical protein TNCV_4504431 [Trichonephila clavipes]|nr:hypothetical protein TNCV_4504431 [Trichonephila clavipes]